jgi:hypothetical protein
MKNVITRVGVTRFAHLLKGKKNCLRQSWIAYLSKLGVQKLWFLCKVWMLVLFTFIKTQCMATMSVNFLLLTTFLSWANSKLMSFQNKNRDMCSLFPFITY